MKFLIPSKKNIVEKSVIFTDYISEVDKWALYKNAITTVLPSLYEGFGMPAIESQQAGTPVIVSFIPSLKEISRRVCHLYRSCQPKWSG